MTRLDAWINGLLSGMAITAAIWICVAFMVGCKPTTTYWVYYDAWIMIKHNVKLGCKPTGETRQGDDGIQLGFQCPDEAIGKVGYYGRTNY